MNKENRRDELLAIIKPYLPDDVDPSVVKPDSNFVEELNINSAHLVDIVLDLEDRYDIVLENEDIDQMQSLDQALDLIDKKLAGK